MAKNYSRLLAIVAILSLLTACEIIVPKQFEADEEAVLELYKDVPLKDVVSKVQKKFQKAKEDEIYFYSPNNYRTARTGLQTARAYFRNPEKRTHVLKSLHRSDQALDEAFKVKVIVARELKDHIELRDVLDSLQAKKSHTREYRSLMTSLMSIIELIENKQEDLFKEPSGRADFDKRKNTMMADMLDFRLRVVKFAYLNHGELLISESLNYDAQNIVPDTYAATIAERDAAVEYISKNVENLEGVSEKASKFQFAAQRLLHITRAVNTVLKLEKNTHEHYVLRQEERLTKIAQALKWAESKNYTFAAQATQMASKIKNIIKDKEKNALMVAELKAGGTVSEMPGQESTTNKTEGDPKPKKEIKGVEIVSNASGGDLEQLKKSVRLLTDQVYQLTIEKNSWEGERASLKAKIKKLQAKQKPKNKPKAAPAKKPASEAKKVNKPKTANQPKKSEPKKAAGEKAKEEAKTEKPAAEAAKETEAAKP